MQYSIFCRRKPALVLSTANFSLYLGKPHMHKERVGKNKVKSDKLQTFRIQYETLKMHDDESIATFFIKVGEVMNSIRNLGEEIKNSYIIEMDLRSLTPNFESIVSAIE